MFRILYPYSKITIFGSHLRHILSERVSPTSRLFFREVGFIAVFFTCPGLRFKSHNHCIKVRLPLLSPPFPPQQSSSMLLLQFVFQTECCLAPDPARHLTPVYSHCFEHIKTWAGGGVAMLCSGPLSSCAKITVQGRLQESALVQTHECL